jgi:hypothetical protein
MLKERPSYRFFLVCAFAAIAWTPLSAQVGTGTILGAVIDTSGAAIPQAVVSVKNLQTGTISSVTTNANGRYVAPDLIVGTYPFQSGSRV